MVSAAWVQSRATWPSGVLGVATAPVDAVWEMGEEGFFGSGPLAALSGSLFTWEQSQALAMVNLEGERWPDAIWISIRGFSYPPGPWLSLLAPDLFFSKSKGKWKRGWLIFPRAHKY